MLWIMKYCIQERNEYTLKLFWKYFLTSAITIHSGGVRPVNLTKSN